MLKVLNGSVRFIGIKSLDNKDQYKTNQKACYGWRKEVSFFTKVCDGRETEDTVQISENFNKGCTLIIKIDLENLYLTIMTLNQDKSNKKFDEIRISPAD